MNLKKWLSENSKDILDRLTNKSDYDEKDNVLNYTTQKQVIDILKDLRSLVIPGIYEQNLTGRSELKETLQNRISSTAEALCSAINYALLHECYEESSPKKCLELAESITIQALGKLPEIKEILDTDFEAAYEGDPAAKSLEEVILSYPSIEAVSIYRIAHMLYSLGVPILPRIMTEYAHKNTGIDIHPGAKIGPNFFIDHGTGVVIGETCTIGGHVKLYQGVTLGAKSFPLDENGKPIKGIKRHPDIEDNVVIYAGATILGGNTRIGRGSVIGGNVWLTESVPPYSTVFNTQPSPVIKSI